MNNKSIDRILLLLGLATGAALFFVGLTKGRAMSSLLWNGDTVGIFPDLFLSIRDAAEGNPYEGTSVYPAFAYLICWILSRFAPGDPVNWGTFSLSPNGNVVGFFFFMLCTLAVFALGYQLLKAYRGKALVLLTLFLFSPGYLYCLERGNMVILTLVFLLFFVGWYDSDQAYERELAFISLAFAAAMKIYPAVFGILLLFRKNWKDVGKTLFYGVTAFTVPFFLFGGLKDIVSMFRSIFSYSVVQRDFGYGYKINIQNIVTASCDWLTTYVKWINISDNLCNFLCYCGLLFLLAGIVTIVMFAGKKWQKVWALTLILTLVPTFSWIYNAIYYLVPLVVYLKDEKIKKFDFWYDICFALIFVPLPYGYIMKTLRGVNKLSYSTMAVFVASLLMTVFIVAEIVLDKKNAKKQGIV